MLVYTKFQWQLRGSGAPLTRRDGERTVGSLRPGRRLKAVRRVVEKANPEQTRWVPISALPVDLQLELKRTRYPARRLGPRPIRPPKPWMMAVGGVGLVMAALHVLTVDDVGAFGSGLRGVGLFGGAALVALFLCGARALGFRSPSGHQVLLGPASVVVADTKAVRVFPAEALTVQKESVLCGSEVVYDFTFDLDSGTSEWSARLRELVAKAKNDESAREEDRYRMAARRARPMSRGAVWWSRRGTQVVALGFALGAAGFAEAGPIEWRGAGNHATNLRARDLLTSTNAASVQRNRAVRAAAAVVHDATERKARERFLKAALEGDSSDARKFLRDYPRADEARPRVQARLHEVCANENQEKRFDPPRQRFLRAVMRAACETPSGHLHFTMTGTPDTEVARDFLREVVTDAAQLASAPEPELDIADPTPPGGPCAPEACPHLRLMMLLLGTSPSTAYYEDEQRWSVDASLIGPDGSPVPNVKYQQRRTITRPRY